jgi:hypothetical protein
MKMRRLSMVLGLAGVLAAPNVFASMTVYLTGGGANQGGPFTAYTSANGTFETFCASIVTTFSPGSTYSYQNSATIAANGVPPALSYVALGTAYIYDQFLKGNASYSGANANAVQSAIWYLQGDLNGYVDPENSVNLFADVNQILNQVVADKPLWSMLDLAKDGNGAYGVQFMNLYGLNNFSEVHQPMLTEVPEPTTMLAGALLLLPFGASAIRILRRKE